MADLTMCYNPKDCPKQDSCRRKLAKPDRLQSYADFYANCQENNFENYWHVDNCVKIVDN